MHVSTGNRIVMHTNKFATNRNGIAIKSNKKLRFENVYDIHLYFINISICRILYNQNIVTVRIFNESQWKRFNQNQ